MKTTATFLFACAVALGIAATPRVAAETPPGGAPGPAWAGSTLQNLQNAFEAEKNAEARYLLFAQTADREGHCGVAALFRAAARGEAIHATLDVKAMAWMGGSARVQLTKNYADESLRNLVASAVLEAELVNEIYPASLAKARVDCQTAGARAFNYALGAEDDHMRAMLALMGEPAAWDRATTWQVCPGCGRLFGQPVNGRCPSCFTPAGRFLRVT